MGKINVLSFAVANLIAAGEVVDRPASVVKELMENSIDAGATRITVEIKNGGVTFLRVTDNGCGMDREDLPMAIRRHATSKIKDATDLDRIMTLGFRGEALAATCAVSDVRIVSKTKGAEIGARLEVHAGEIRSLSEQGCSEGTTIVVENLFETVPARRKFLKRDVTEAMAVTANVERLAISHPEISFHLIVDGNLKLETVGDGQLMSAIWAVFGKDFASRLIPIEGELDGIRIHGYIGRSDNVKATRNYETFYINGRYVKSKTATAALEQAFVSYMPQERYPVCVLFLELNPGKVDVNVHPAKLEVKFSNEKPVFETIYYTVRTALEQNVTRPELRLQSASGSRMSDRSIPVSDGKAASLKNLQISVSDFSKNQSYHSETSVSLESVRGIHEKNASPVFERVSAQEYRNRYLGASETPPIQNSVPDSEKRSVSRFTESDVKTDEVVPVHMQKTEQHEVFVHPSDTFKTSTEEQPFARITKTEPVRKIPVDLNTTGGVDSLSNEKAPIPEYRIIGEAFHSYVLVEKEERLLLIDKHAAHERLIFEKLKANMKAVAVPSQMLMLPVEVVLMSDEVGLLEEYRSELESIGFSFRTSRNTVYTDAIPDGIDPNAVSDMLSAIADRIKSTTGDAKITRDILFEKALYQASCKAAIKAGREYPKEHIDWLVGEMMKLPDITFCPHGRPVAMELTKKYLDHQFERT